MQTHIRILGILLLACGILSLVTAVVIAAAGIGIPIFIMCVEHLNDEEVLISFLVMGAATFISILIAIFSAPSILGGLGLLTRHSWARAWSIVASIIELTSIPFGTAVGIYGLWVLFQDETKEILKGS